jgi:hypothetical protein
VSLWFKHDAHFHEHPKALRMRRLAGARADSCEVGWWRIIASGRRLGRWTFADEEHLEDAAGRYYRFVPIYREVGLLDGLTIHGGDDYQSPMTGAERVAKHRARNAGVVTPGVTDVTPRETRQEREETEDDRADLEAFLLVRRRAPTAKQRKLLDEILARHDVTGPAWAADIILRHPDDPIGAVLEADRAWREQRIADAIKAEKPKPRAVRSGGLPASVRETLAAWSEAKKDDAA